MWDAQSGSGADAGATDEGRAPLVARPNAASSRPASPAPLAATRRGLPLRGRQTAQRHARDDADARELALTFDDLTLGERLWSLGVV